MENINQPGRYKCIDIPKFISSSRWNSELVRDHFDDNDTVTITEICEDGDGYARNDTYDASDDGLSLAVFNNEWDLFELVE